MTGTNVGSPKGREPYGDTGAVVVVRVTPHQGGREGRPQGEGHQVAGYPDTERVCEMQSAETVLGVLRERGRRGLPVNELYRQLFNPELYFLAYGNIYSNKGAMTPGPDGETADGMSRGKIGRIIDAMRHERYRFQPVRRVYIPKKNGKLRPLGMPSWPDKLVGEVIRLLLEAYYEPQFSGRSHGFRRGRGCHTALSEVSETWTGTAWFIESDISDCLADLTMRSCCRSWERRSSITGSCGLSNRCSKPGTWRTGNTTTRFPGCRKAAWSRPCSPISTCTGWTNSSRQFSCRNIPGESAGHPALPTSG